MAARDNPESGRFAGRDLSEDTTETMMMRPVAGTRRSAADGTEPSDSGDEPWEQETQSASAGLDRPPPSRQPRRGGGALARSVRTVGEVFITLGIVLLLFVVYELYITNIFSSMKQAEAEQSLTRRWQDSKRELQVDPANGKAFARIYIPSFGADYSFTIQEGVGADALSVGPGHYVNSAMPGQQGNFAVAGHRVGKGAPFNDLDLLKSCDPIVIETASDFFVYRVLPMKGQVGNWKEYKKSHPKCAGVSSLRSSTESSASAYSKTFGRKIVAPDMGSAIAPVPYRPQSSLAKSDQVDMMTLTTCHPQFSAAQRMIIHSVLVKQFKKGPNSGGYEQVLREIRSDTGG